MPAYAKCVRMMGGLNDKEINQTYVKVIYFPKSWHDTYFNQSIVISYLLTACTVTDFKNIFIVLLAALFPDLPHSFRHLLLHFSAT